MKHKVLSILLLLSLVISLSGSATAQTGKTQDGLALVAVEILAPGDLSRFEASGLPAYARLQESLLAGADAAGQALLRQAGLTFQVLDTDLRGAAYYLTYAAPGRVIEWSAYGDVLLEDGEQVLLRTTAQQAESLSLAGAGLRRVTLDPKPLRPATAPLSFPEDIVPDPLIQVMIDQVDSSTVYTYTGGLSGEWPVDIGGSPYTILTRHTNSGEPIQKATQYVGEHLENLGLDVEYHQWNAPTNPNVIGELPGLTNPDDIFIIGGHLDDMPSSGPAPGADDNASGSVAAMIAADILTQYQWGCTLRFALWTGEEQGLNGSEAYAERSYNQGENILGYLNLDMISWNTPNSSPDIDLIYNPNMPPTQELAQLFDDVVSAYNLNLIPQILSSLGGGSDHQSFWTYGYTAILGIEDQGDFNPYYHTSQDLLEHLDIPYYTQFIKAAVGTFAHMTNCLIPGGLGALDGTITADNGGAPLEGALVVAENGEGTQFPIQTDASGYYTRTLLADAYTVTASSYGYLPATVTDVAIITDTVTTQDFSLLEAPQHIVSGTVTEAGTGVPLLAEVVFEGSPVSVWTDPWTGFYSATLPEGTYTMHVTADLHEPESRVITLDGDRTEDFALNPLPCILLVDDDNNAPDVLPYYTAALDSLGYGYNVFTASGVSDGPELSGLQGYDTVIWFSGDKYGNSAGPNGTDEANLADYLDGGGNLFLSSQDYLYDFNLTPFGEEYLGISTYSDDTGNATTKYGVAGDPIGDGLGPYNLSYPSDFEDFGDIVNADVGASVAFRSLPGGGNSLDVDKDSGAWQTVFFGTSWVPVYNYNAGNGELLLGRIIDWFGGCEAYGVTLSGDDAQTGIPGQTLTYTLSVTNTSTTMTDTFTVSLGASLFPAAADAMEAGPLAPGESAAFHVTVDIPESALPGEMDAVDVTVTSQGDGDRWDSATLTTTVGGSYGVELDVPSTEGFGPPGGSVTYTVSLTNSGSLQDTLVLTYFGVSPGWEVHLAEDSFDLAGGERAETSLHVFIPANAEQGDLEIFFLRAVSSHDPSQWNEIGLTTTVYEECVPPSELDFTWSPLDPWSGEEVIFSASALGSEPFSYLWELGDGEAAEGEQVAHLYEAGGVYTVTLSASNACGEASLSQSLVVAPGTQVYLPVIALAGP